MPFFTCKDIGMTWDFGATARTEDELMKKIAGHASKAHKMKTIPPHIIEEVGKPMKK